HTVVLFEKSPKIGGILRYGIPDFKLPKTVIDRRLAQMESEGVRFETGVVIGEDISARYLRNMFDVVLLTMGAGEPRDLKVPGRELEGIHFAMEYLTLSNRYIGGEIGEESTISAKDKTVLVIGGGDTGADCVGTANRQGASKIYQFEIMPKPREWEKDWNPSWPDWPRILRTSTSHEEGCERRWSILTKSFSERDGAVGKGLFAQVDWEKAAGRRGAPPEIDGSGFELNVDLVLLAMGFVHVEHSRLISDLGLSLDDRGNIKTDEYATSEKGIYAAGDAFTGASLVVRAIYHGRRAAESIDRYLR
ncbi:MAG: glutamate synthase, partial [Chitinivibrionales bacterium]|nr:glutamate synthase [Chitinivibrionales bacterium]MBD3358151.1 glutamate synthase [Chitinivibrionales bacterium]